MNRKASDVLFDIDSKTDEMMSIIKNQDLLLKVLSNKIFELDNKLNSASQNLLVNNVDISKPVEKMVGKNSISDDSGTVLVSQIIKNSDGKGVSMAKVEIFSINDDGNMILVQGKKANVSGKWTANLKPGKFKVKAFKLISDKESFQVECDVIIPNDKEIVQLDPMVG
jgi:hypothetical protein